MNKQNLTLLRNLDLKDIYFTAQQMDTNDKALHTLVRDKDVTVGYKITDRGKKKLAKELVNA